MVQPLRPRALALAATLAALAAAPATAWSQAEPLPASGGTLAPAENDPDETAAFNAGLFYEVLVGEMAAGVGDPGSGQQLMLNAARQSRNPQLYRRATEMALQARAGNQALLAAQAWREAFPESRNANRYVLQILVALNRVADTLPYLRQEIDSTPAPSKPVTFLSITQLYSRVTDKALAAQIVEQALQGQLADPAAGPSAYAAIGHMQLVAGNPAAALQAVQKAEALSPGNGAAALLALELLENGQREAEPLVARYVEQQRGADMRMAYARVLLGQDRLEPAETQLLAITRETPDYADAWFTLARLQAQTQRWPEAEASLQRFDALVPQLPNAGSQRSARTESALLHALIAQKQGRFAPALEWLGRIENGTELLNVQVRRASILAQQGQLEQARAAIQAVPASTPQQQRLRQQAEVQVVREADQPALAYALQSQLQQQFPQDNEIAYDTAILAEKVGRFEEMESLLRAIIARDPGFHHAYNALGFSFAERGVRLDEARALITRALEATPNDPFIIDSLAWTEFRSGNTAMAQSLLEKAYALRPDAEIAAHLGEVLWSTGQRRQAREVWQKGLQLNADNDTLRETLQRLGVKP
ncbi:tetratricopeptide repeat protein [Comamonas endophytica]|uniref:Tetratricopeptide repeat protein n=1 Tax=Comamonas endophytica TaxID=2949090 RepID=A0ABY6GE68_9BURK|nr:MULTISPECIES: tetratricopeptide repeat protein [unclassified Acidovorax]MCD2513060.1 tetratricopeptide repeat protein [Acidovorax sp. D4N7]UYG52600.1 tetratricopeptide repeat protein [Acidovorax sp. 5MLIR]